MQLLVVTLALWSAGSLPPHAMSLVPPLALSADVKPPCLAAADIRGAAERVVQAANGPGDDDAEPDAEARSSTMGRAVVGSGVGNLVGIGVGVGLGLMLALVAEGTGQDPYAGMAIGVLTGMVVLAVVPPILATRAARTAAGHEGGGWGLPLLTQLAVMGASVAIGAATESGAAVALTYAAGTLALMPLVASRGVDRAGSRKAAVGGLAIAF